MEQTPSHISFDAMAAKWLVTIWDVIEENELERIKAHIVSEAEEFENIFSRFRPHSFISGLAGKTGTIIVPRDFTVMMKLYFKLFVETNGKCNPLIGELLNDIGYDPSYSLKPKEIVHTAPNLIESIKIIDDTTIELLHPVQFDFGCLGKGYFVDKTSAYLTSLGLKRTLVNGSGDIFYEGNGIPIRAGLEDPSDPTKVVGVIELEKGGFCASGSNRRRWGKHHHIVDATTAISPEEIVASWVRAESCMLADGLATCVFLTPPETLQKHFDFEYCVMNPERRVKKSEGLIVELF